MIPVGVVLFDRPEAPTSGWACCSPIHQDTAERIQYATDLPTDCVWVTNLDHPQFAQAGFLHSGNLRKMTFLRSNLRQITAELGLESEPPEVAASALARIMWRCVLLAGRVGMPAATGIAGESLAHALRDSVLQPQLPPNTQELAVALRSALQVDSSCAAAPRGSSIAIVRRNRPQHVADLLQTAVPQGAWRFFGESELPINMRQRVIWATDTAKPSLVRARVSRVRPEYGELHAFGVSFNANMAVRQWISQPELLWLSEIAEVQITAAYQCEAYSTIPLTQVAQAAIEDDFGLPGSLVHLSSSVGLFLDSLTTALMLDTRSKARVYAPVVHPSAVWIRAVDRALSFAAAVKMSKMGALVLGYGNGAVRVAVEHGGADGVLRQAASAGLVAGLSTTTQARVTADLEVA